MRKALALCAVLALSACTAQAAEHHEGLRVVTTTPILADIATNVAGERAEVTALVPASGDPHSYEPTLRDIRRIATSDLVLSNGLLLEEQRLTRALDANLREGAEHIAVAEEAPRHGARIIPLVEDLSLSTIWLGMRVLGQAEKGTSILISAVEASGPGRLSAYLTGTFGQPSPYIDSSDGIDENDVISLPPDAHTHMSWAFSAPGNYTLTLRAERVSSSARNDLGTATIRFAVGRTSPAGYTALDAGHMDIAADVNGGIVLWGDRLDGAPGNAMYKPEEAVVVVPDTALANIPADPAYRFLGRPGGETYILAQAVLGKHVHGDIDPHMWLDPSSGIAYAEVIRDALIAGDPQGRKVYEDNARRYIAKIARAKDYMAYAIGQIPNENRNLITTHDGFGYLSSAFGLKTAGFVAPNPNVEPSTKDSIALNRTIQTLKVPAVFLEPNVAAHSGELVQAAHRNGVRVCHIYSEAFDDVVTDYLDLLTTDAYNLAVCLNPTALGPLTFDAYTPENEDIS